VAAHLDEVQDGLGRPYVIENPSSYVAFRASTMTEVEFLNELVRRTGCELLCDVSNVYLSAHNMAHDPYRFFDSLPADVITEFHLGGFTPEDDEATPGGTLLVDTHASTFHHWPRCLLKRREPRLFPRMRFQARSHVPALADRTLRCAPSFRHAWKLGEREACGGNREACGGNRAGSDRVNALL
jgi:uncharacterized protein DUF692